MTEVAKFSIDYVQILNEQSQITGNLPEFAQNPDNLINLYRVMVMTRAYDAKAIALQRTGKMGTYASTLGQEAIGTAVGSVMAPDDVLCPFYRDYPAQLQRGVKLSEIYTYWGGDERGNCFADNAEDFPIAVPIASQCLHAAGVATAFKIRQQKRVAVSSCGDGATSEGDFYEAINVAGAWNLPLVFVVNNNQWAISVPRDIQTGAKTIAQKAIAAGFDGVQVDGNDVIALHEVIGAAIEKARRGEGPTLVEALTYRLCDHTTADDASRYRSDEEVQKARDIEPVKRLREYLIAQKQWDEAKEAALREECAQKVDDAVNQYEKCEKQSYASSFEYHYENMPVGLREQCDAAMEELNHG